MRQNWKCHTMKRPNIIWQEWKYMRKRESVRDQIDTIKMTQKVKKHEHKRAQKNIWWILSYNKYSLNIRQPHLPTDFFPLNWKSQDRYDLCACLSVYACPFQIMVYNGGETSKWIGYSYPINMQYARQIRYIYQKRWPNGRFTYWWWWWWWWWWWLCWWWWIYSEKSTNLKGDFLCT